MVLAAGFVFVAGGLDGIYADVDTAQTAGSGVAEAAVSVKNLLGRFLRQLQKRSQVISISHPTR